MAARAQLTADRGDREAPPQQGVHRGVPFTVPCNDTTFPPARIPEPVGLLRRKLLGEQVLQRLFELDAAVADADLGIGLLWKGLEVTAIDGTTMELARNGVLDGEFGAPADGARPLLRVTVHVRTATFR